MNRSERRLETAGLVNMVCGSINLVLGSIAGAGSIVYEASRHIYDGSVLSPNNSQLDSMTPAMLAAAGVMAASGIALQLVGQRQMAEAANRSA